MSALTQAALTHFASTTCYGFPVGHVFAIRDPDEVLYEHLGHDGLILEARPVASPALRQVFTQHEFRALVATGKVDPRLTENSVARNRIAALNPDIGSARDLSDDEREALVFYTRLCRRVEDMYQAGETSKTDVALDRTIRKVMAELYLGLDPDDEPQVPSRRPGNASRGRKTVQPAKDPQVRRLKARKTVTTYQVPSPTTVREWIGKLIEHDWDELAIRDGRKGRGGNRPPKITHPLVISIMGDWVRAYLDRSRPTGAVLYRLMVGAVDIDEVNGKREAQGLDPIPVLDLPTFEETNAARAADGLPPLKIPSKSSFERAIRKLDRFQVCVARQGLQEARRRFKIAGKRTAALAAGERVALDCWRIQLTTRRLPRHVWAGLGEEQIAKMKSLRLNVCVALCEATKVPLGVRLSVNADAETSIRTLEMVCRDKSDIAHEAGCRSTWHQACSPESVATDSGSEFVDTAFRWAVRDISASNETGPGAHPDARPAIERFFGTLDMQFSQFFQGRTFSSVVDKGDYDPTAFANVVVEVLRKALVRYLVDVYMNSPHAGLGGQTPADAWEEKTRRFGVVPPPAPEVLRSVFGLADTRRIQNRGVRLFGLHYRSEELARLRFKVGQADVRIRADLQDLRAISVCENRPGAKWFTVPCDIDMKGVSAIEWLATAAALRDRHADATRLREPVVRAAMRDIRLSGIQSALEAGLGPSTMSNADLLREEAVHFRHFGIVTAESRGRTLEGTGEVARQLLLEDDPAVDGETDQLDDPLEDGTHRPISGRRRDRLGSHFLTEEE